jgi:hypothetical protein
LMPNTSSAATKLTGPIQSLLISCCRAGLNAWCCAIQSGTLPDELSLLSKGQTGHQGALRIHAHSDAEWLVTLAAVREGMDTGTINGYGERCGITALFIMRR